MAKRSNQIPRDMREYRLVCTGLTEEDFTSLYDTLKHKLRLRVALRNPFLPTFGPQGVHEMIVAGTTVAGAVGRKVLDVIADIVKRKLGERETGKRQVILYDHNDRPYATVKVKPPKVKR
jgi:hypothetical protein